MALGYVPCVACGSQMTIETLRPQYQKDVCPECRELAIEWAAKQARGDWRPKEVDKARVDEAKHQGEIAGDVFMDSLKRDLESTDTD